jgi:hypothetical protein
MDDTVGLLTIDTQFRQDVVHLASTELPSVDGSTVKAALRDITVAGYDIIGVIDDAANTDPEQLTLEWWKEHDVARRDIPAYLNAVRVPGEIRAIPRFVAACVVEMRARYGVLAKSEANILLVGQWYAKLCKQHCVRQSDVVRHRQLVLNCFFSETFDFEHANARYNAPYWLKALRGEVTQFTRQPVVS